MAGIKQHNQQQQQELQSRRSQRHDRSCGRGSAAAVATGAAAMRTNIPLLILFPNLQVPGCADLHDRGAGQLCHSTGRLWLRQ